MERLTGLSYETNTVGEIIELTMGESITVFETVSPSFWQSAMLSSGFVLPSLVIVVLAVLCAASGILLLVTGGRILRVRPFVNVTLIAGAGATVAPLLSMLLLRIQYAVRDGLVLADIKMQHIVLSLEAICVMGILVCVLLPSLASLRRVAAYAHKERDFVCLPYRCLSKRSFGSIKIVALLSIIAFLLLIGCFFAFPFTSAAHRSVDAVLQSIVGDWNAAVIAVKCLFAKDGSGSAMEGAAAVMGIACYLWMLLVLFGALCALIALLRVLFIKKDKLQKRKKNHKRVKKYPKAVRNAVLAPFVTFFVLQALMCVFFLFFTSVAMHLNFENVNETLSVVYLTVAYVRTLGMTNTLYSFFLVGGLALWYTADQATAALIVRAR
jgi:hypothetical protein